LVDLQRPLITNEQIDKVFHNIDGFLPFFSAPHGTARHRIVARSVRSLKLLMLTELHKLAQAFSADLEEIKAERVLLEQISTTLLHYSPQFRIYQVNPS
jgi:hypothetical protein